jgi:Chromo (CHRromatin Organisation MOdifier) domain
MDVPRKDYSEVFVEIVLYHSEQTNRQSTLRFKINWLGYDETHNTFEPWANLGDMEILHRYLIDNNLRKSRKIGVCFAEGLALSRSRYIIKPSRSGSIRQIIFRQALTDIFLHRNTVLKKTCADTIEFINKHATDQLLNQLFIHKQPTLVDYATTLLDMVERFRADNPLSTQVLSPTTTMVQPTEHESMKDPYATMEIGGIALLAVSVVALVRQWSRVSRRA